MKGRERLKRLRMSSKGRSWKKNSLRLKEKDSEK
jgi:hypothetical protein